jgi:hypothetical protein
MAYLLTSPYIGAQAITEVSSVQKCPLGTVVNAVDATLGAGVFVYAKGVANTVAGSVVTFYESDWTTALLAADAKGQVGVAMAAIDAATKYGWYQICGKAIAKCVAAVADNGLVYACSTGGSIDDAATAGDRVKKAFTASATDTPATGFCYIEIQYPFMDDGSSA